MSKADKSDNKTKLLSQTRRLRDAMAWLVKGFTLYDPRKSYQNFYLSPQQSYVLWVVSEEGRVSPGDVAKRLRLEKSHLTKIVKSLIEMGAIDTLPDELDRRKLVLVLSDEGKRIIRELDKASIDSYQPLMEKIPPTDRENVIRATEVMLEAMNKLRREEE